MRKGVLILPQLGQPTDVEKGDVLVGDTAVSFNLSQECCGGLDCSTRKGEVELPQHSANGAGHLRDAQRRAADRRDKSAKRGQRRGCCCEVGRRTKVVPGPTKSRTAASTASMDSSGRPVPSKRHQWWATAASSSARYAAGVRRIPAHYIDHRRIGLVISSARKDRRALAALCEGRRTGGIVWATGLWGRYTAIRDSAGRRICWRKASEVIGAVTSDPSPACSRSRRCRAASPWSSWNSMLSSLTWVPFQVKFIEPVSSQSRPTMSFSWRSSLE